MRRRPPTIATCRQPPYAIGGRDDRSAIKSKIFLIFYSFIPLWAPLSCDDPQIASNARTWSGIYRPTRPGRYVRCISFSSFSASARLNLGNVKKAWDICEILRHVVLQLQMGHNWKLKMKLWCANRFHKNKTKYKSVHIRMIMREICESEVCDLAGRTHGLKVKTCKKLSNCTSRRAS